MQTHLQVGVPNQQEGAPFCRMHPFHMISPAIPCCTYVTTSS